MRNATLSLQNLFRRLLPLICLVGYLLLVMHPLLAHADRLRQTQKSLLSSAETVISSVDTSKTQDCEVCKQAGTLNQSLSTGGHFHLTAGPCIDVCPAISETHSEQTFHRQSARAPPQTPWLT